MIARTAVINLSGDHEESVERLAKHLGTDKLRRKLFNAIYGRGNLPRSKKQIMEIAGILPRESQQAQNEINHLATHHLIVREDNDGSVKDGSRFLYRKDDSVRAVRREIIKYADDRKARDKLPTKRRPAGAVVRSVRTFRKQALAKKSLLKVIYLTANSNRRHSLRVDAEVLKVKEAIRASVFRDNVSVEYYPAAGLKTLLDGLNDHRPQIVHFSGHGNVQGIAMDTGKVGRGIREPLSFLLLARALQATDAPPRIIVLNSCDSSGARKTLLKLGLIVVSMKAPITDLSAIVFAPRFYAAIASGQSIKSAFAQAKVAVEAASISEAGTPELSCPAGTNPAKITLT